MELFFGRRGLIWLLKADEGVKFLDSITWRDELETLNLTVGGEKILQLLLSGSLWESFDIKVASFL